MEKELEHAVHESAEYQQRYNQLCYDFKQKETECQVLKSALDYKVDCLNANANPENKTIRLTPEILLENAELRNNLDLETKTRKKMGETVKQKS